MLDFISAIWPDLKGVSAWTGLIIAALSIMAYRLALRILGRTVASAFEGVAHPLTKAVNELSGQLVVLGRSIESLRGDFAVMSRSLERAWERIENLEKERERAS